VSARYRLAWIAVIVFALVLGGALAFGDAAPRFMLRPLTHERHLPDSVSADGAVVYVLGGTPDSLEHKFETAARLIRQRKADRIVVLSREGLMAFSPARNRNLTANEWAVDKLAAVGVAADKVQLIVVDEGFFGTWSEAQGVSRLAKERSFHRLVLVTSPYHSRRVWESFSRTLEQANTPLFLYHSTETASLRLLIPEYIKLFFYRMLLF
jgi:uncharacterized SAM-binding protein YcdF (DUF218 family)